MNGHEIRTIRQEAERFAKEVKVCDIGEEDSVKIELPYLNEEGEILYFFVAKRKNSKKFIMIMPVLSTGIITIPSTLALLQPLLGTYGLILTQDAVIIEESGLSLNKRFRNMAQAIVSIDGIRRMWKTIQERSNAAKSKDSESISNSTNDSSSR